ncbi:DUF3037 domain-containing protein [Aurantimonas sp. E1-2-R+4]|uniref:DUF3037 domain-containing protein n=1 Tax=Aurantimonas sp. E1-2-R+4 TaxID=3113714 RepID=UPI002F927F4A
MSEQAYYSIIQYADEPERFEFVNVGVLLLKFKTPRILIRVVDNAKRVNRMLGRMARPSFQDALISLENRIALEFSHGWERDQVEYFKMKQSGRLRLSQLRSVLVEDDSEALVDELFQKLVGDLEVGPQRAPQARHQLKRELKALNVAHLLDSQPKPFELPQGVTINAPFAYQNGAYNYLYPVSLKGDPDEAIKNAGASALEGEWLADVTGGVNAKRLVVVGDVEGQKPTFIDAIEKVMNRSDISFYRLGDLGPLATEIRKHYEYHRRN